MKEEYVNEEITRKLIDKGCPVRLVIKADEPIPILYELPKEHPDWQDCKAWYIPTISQVLKWLREEKNLYCLPFFEQGVDLWFYVICKSACGSEFPVFISESDYNTYEQAALTGIKYTLDNLI